MTKTPVGTDQKSGVFARMMLFIRQVIGELKKVSTPSQKELIRYTAVVIIFVVIMIGIATVLDLAFGTAANFVFGGGNGDS